jgi:2-succinyl-5-enolpyruvyl-6-hydroxy-3-cyclohexene-1-carboxylate synthase
MRKLCLPGDLGFSHDFNTLAAMRAMREMNMTKQE